MKYSLGSLMLFVLAVSVACGTFVLGYRMGALSMVRNLNGDRIEAESNEPPPAIYEVQERISY